MSELVNAKYLIEKIGIDQAWVRHILKKRLKSQCISNRFRMYKKEEVDEIIEEYKIASEPKKANEWDLNDIKNHFKISYTYAQRLALCEGFPEPCRAVKGDYPGKHKRVWLDSDIKKIRLGDYPWSHLKGKGQRTASTTKLKDVEIQFLRRFRV